MDEEKNLEQNKPKQKPGLGAVRPDDYTTDKFKEMANENNISQTEMFKRIFYNYLKNEREKKQQQALSLDSEINLISGNLNSILSIFKTITDKAQNTIISIETNADQTIKNLTLEIDTLKKQVTEYDNRNKELELSNSTFSEVKSSLENNIRELTELTGRLQKEKEQIKNDLIFKNKKLTELEENYKRTSESYTSENKSLAGIVNNLRNELDTYHNKIKNLEISNSSLDDTIKNLQNLKKSEIDAIEEKYKLQIQDLEIKLKNFKESKDKEIQSIKRNIETEMTAARKEETADLKLELANMKEKYSETLIELNTLKQKNNN